MFRPLVDTASRMLCRMPNSIRNELKAPGVVEAHGCFNQADIGLSNKVRQRKAEPLVLFGDGDGKSQVGLDEFTDGMFIAICNSNAQLGFLVRANQ